MTGIVHLRIVTTIFVFGGIVMLLPYALSFLVDGVRTPPIGLIGGAGNIAVGIWFSRGSQIARYLMIASSIICVLACVSFMAVMLATDDDRFTAALFGAAGAVGGYCIWALMFSKELRAELSRRGNAIRKTESEERQKFYDQVSERSE
jgi:FtsH-binding integral membrane protein